MSWDYGTFYLRKLIFKRACAAIQWLDVGFLVGLFVYFHTSYVRTGEGSGENARMRRLAWAFSGRLREKYHNLISWLKYAFGSHRVPYLVSTTVKYITIWFQMSFLEWMASLIDSFGTISKQ